MTVGPWERPNVPFTVPLGLFSDSEQLPHKSICSGFPTMLSVSRRLGSEVLTMPSAGGAAASAGALGLTPLHAQAWRD